MTKILSQKNFKLSEISFWSPLSFDILINKVSKVFSLIASKFSLWKTHSFTLDSDCWILLLNVWVFPIWHLLVIFISFQISTFHHRKFKVRNKRFGETVLSNEADYNFNIHFINTFKDFGWRGLSSNLKPCIDHSLT